jgi:hypothetical protein
VRRAATRPRALPIAGVGAPAPYRLVASYLVAALVALLLAAGAALTAADEIARGGFAASDVLLAVHLFSLAFLPLAVGGAALHVLPLVLRGVPGERRGWVAFACLLPGPLLAVGIARHHGALTWASGTLVTAGLALVLAEALRLVVRSPRGRTIVVSRFGVVAAAAHAALGFLLGPLLFSLRWRPWAGIPHDRLIAIHLHLSLIGAVTLLVLTVGRTLVPMLAVAPTAPRRRFPTDEVVLTAGLWVSIAGFAAGERWAVGLGGAVIVVAVARFLALVARTVRTRRVPAVEGPLLHALTGLVFLAQATVLGVILLDRPGDGRVVTAYAVTLLVGWGVGVTVGHAGKLLALSAWAWWPPGPRPKQSAFYDRRVWAAEAAAFLAGVELLVAGALTGSTAVARGGGALLVLAALLALTGAVRTLSLVAGHGNHEAATAAAPGGSPAPAGPDEVGQ